MNRRPRRASASPRLTEREAARDVLEMLGLVRDACPREGPPALGAGERDDVRRAIRAALLPDGVGGLGPLDVALFALAHDAPSSPGERIRVTKAGAVRERDDETGSGARTRPSRRAARSTLAGLVQAIEAASPDADAHKCLALILMVFALDGVAGGDLSKAPTGRARVAWLAKRIEDATRDRAR